MSIQDLIFFAILLVFSNIWLGSSSQELVITISLYGEIYNNRQLECRIMFIKFIIVYIYNYIHSTFNEHDYMVNITDDNKIEFLISPDLYSSISRHFATNISGYQLTNTVWLSRLSPSYRSKFVHYFLIFLNYANNKGFFYMSRDMHNPIDQVNQVLIKYLTNHPTTLSYYNYITEPQNIGATMYGFKIDMKHIKKYIITNGLTTSLCNIDQYYPTLTSPVLLANHMNYAREYITQTHLEYKETVLDAEYIDDISMELDVFI